MDFHDTLDKSLRYARDALEHMAKRGIPAVPKNFAVWYGYAAGQNPDLTRTINVLVQSGKPFTDASNDELFEQFIGFGTQNEAMAKANESLEHLVGQVADILGNAGADVSRYGSYLQGVSGQIDPAAGAAGLKILVQELLAETKKVEQQNARLSQQLDKSSSEVKTLTDSLEKAKRDAMTDGLTGINNRKHFDLSLRDLCAQSMESGLPLCLLMVDIDHFKKFNDTFGHQMGDQVLKLVARTMSDVIRPGDMAARYGGEEFSVIMPNALIDDAEQIGNAIREAVASKKITKRSTGEVLGTITLSVGIGLYAPGEPLGKLVQRADAALYTAKRGGRNRVVSELQIDPAELAQQGLAKAS